MRLDELPGDVDFACPKRMRTYLNRMAAGVRGLFPVAGKGMVVRDALGAPGKVFSSKAISAGVASTVFRPFQIADDGTSTSKARIYSSNLASDVPDGFSPGDDPPYVLPVSDGDVIYGCVTYDTTGDVIGAVTSRTLGAGADVPDDDPEGATFYYRIGSVAVSGAGLVTGTNDAYGPIDAAAYRNWFAADPVLYAIVWNASA